MTSAENQYSTCTSIPEYRYLGRNPLNKLCKITGCNTLSMSLTGTQGISPKNPHEVPVQLRTQHGHRMHPWDILLTLLTLQQTSILCRRGQPYRVTDINRQRCSGVRGTNGLSGWMRRRNFTCRRGHGTPSPVNLARLSIPDHRRLDQLIHLRKRAPIDWGPSSS